MDKNGKIMKSKTLKLGQLTPPEYLGCSSAQAIFDNTWGHLSPVKNTSYKGKVGLYSLIMVNMVDKQ